MFRSCLHFCVHNSTIMLMRCLLFCVHSNQESASVSINRQVGKGKVGHKHSVMLCLLKQMDFLAIYIHPSAQNYISYNSNFPVSFPEILTNSKQMNIDILKMWIKVFNKIFSQLYLQTSNSLMVLIL